MLKKLEFKLVFFTLILLPILRGNIRNVLFGIVILIGTHFVLSYVKNRKYKISLKKEDIEGRILIASVLLISYSCFNIVLNGFNYSVLERIIQLYACLVVLLMSSIYEWEEKDYKFCISLIRISILACIVMWPISGFKTNYFNGIFTLGNSLGGALFCYMGIYLGIDRKYTIIDKFIIIASFVLMYFSNSRSAMISLLIFLMFRYLFTRKIIKNSKVIIYILILAFTIFPIVYVALYKSELRQILNELSWKYFRKNFFSGRQVLWEPILEAIESKLFLGYGLDMAPEKIVGIGRSSHNWYIQILLQFGVIGYLFTINIINVVWKTLNRMKNNFNSLSTSGFIIGMLVWQCFEVAITQNNIPVGILVWFVMGMGINNSLTKLNKKV